MNLYNVTAKITLDTSAYDNGIDNAKAKTQDFADKTAKNIGVMAANAWLQIGQAVVQYGQKLAQATLDLVDYADKYGDLSAKYDISSKSLQELEYIGTQTGTTLEGLLSTMTMMYNRAKENDEVFGKLGVSVRDVNGNMKSMDELFWETKKALDGVENSGDRSALMLEAFGRNAMSIGEFLRKDTAELQALKQKANDLGIVLSEDVVDSAGEVNDYLDEMALRGKSAFVNLIMGAEGADKQFDEYLDEIVDKVDELAPRLLDAGGRLALALLKGLWEIVKNNLGRLLLQPIEWVANLFGTSIYPSKNENVSRETLDEEVLPSGTDYSVNTNNTNTMRLEVTTKGDTKIDEENAELIAKKLVPYVDQNLGRL